MICPLCGGELIWNNDEMGRIYDIIDPTKEEKSKLSYWNHA